MVKVTVGIEEMACGMCEPYEKKGLFGKAKGWTV